MDETRFGPFGDRVWLDTAHQGALPRAAREAGERSLAEKSDPHRITDESFTELPRRLKADLAGLIGGRPEQIVLGNSTSYGLHALSMGLPLGRGDEVLLVNGDFPATVTPWLPLRRRGVEVRLIEPREGFLTAEDVADAITPRTRVLCTSWVFSFSGHAVDLEAIGGVCREHGVRLVVNGSQGVGARPIEARSLPIDALAGCGWKWLCGPYATGFLWLADDLAAEVGTEHAYWLTGIAQGDLGSAVSYELRPDPGNERLDVFGTANFLSFEPWRAAVDVVREIGIERVAEHDQVLVERLLAGLPEDRWELVSPREGPGRSTLVLIRPSGGTPVADVHGQLRRAGVDCAFRAGSLRFSPHVYNDSADIDRALEALAA
jgi:cysteine desulfurase / selenocysteine lyase